MKGSLNEPIGKRSHEETEGFNEEENSRVQSRPRAGESVPQSMLSDCNLTGLVFISKINHRHRCFIPSTKNYFGGIQVKKVLCDTGCSTILLPLEEDQITLIFLKFSADDFIISVGESSNPGGLSSVLKIKHKDTVDFELKLCQDLVGNCSSISVERLRFALCSADVRKILNTPALLERLTRQGAANLRQDAVEHPNRQRRTHALLGMSVLRKLSVVRYSSIEFFVDPKEYRLANWREISSETEKLLEQIKLPECFDDWEDDDKLGCDDAEDFEYDEDE
jgi:hypothetical protein